MAEEQLNCPNKSPQRRCALLLLGIKFRAYK